jgi:hypothetical protein
MSDAWKNRIKLKSEDIINIRNLYYQGVSNLFIRFKVSKDYIRKILAYKVWKNLYE